MGTIITVHGTGATGPLEGDLWWQKGSYFEKHLRALVEANDGELIFEPLVWDGKNSETSRFEAGRRLQRCILDLEKRGQDYCLLGHSHGGSVICHSLLQAWYEKHELQNLRRWISIGTPFIETKKHFLLFSRLDYLGGAAYLIFAYLFIAYVAFLISILFSGADNPKVDFVLIAAGAVLLSAIYFALHLVQPKKLKMLRLHLAPELQDAIGSKWFALRHKDDEAIHGLRLIRDVRLSPFDKHFAMPAFSFASLLLLPVLMYVLSQHVDYGLLVNNIKAWSAFSSTPEVAADPFERFARNNLSVITYPSHYLFEALKYFQIGRTGNEFFDYTILGIVLFMGANVGFLLLWFGGLVFRLLVIVVGSLLSHGLSLVLNWATREQLKRLSLGSDTIGETAVAAGQRPHWIKTVNGALPIALSDEIAMISDAAAARSIEKFRAALGTLAFSEQKRTVGSVIDEYLTWQELIHTSYFHASRFRKLIAYIVSQTEGFRPTAEFKDDPDYTLVAEWYAEMMQAVQAPSKVAISQPSN